MPVREGNYESQLGLARSPFIRTKHASDRSPPAHSVGGRAAFWTTARRRSPRLAPVFGAGPPVGDGIATIEEGDDPHEVTGRDLAGDDDAERVPTPPRARERS